MNCVLKDGLVYLDEGFIRANVFIRGGVVTAIGDGAPSPDDRVINCTGLHIFPGFTDVHVHVREPGFSYKETIKTGTLAAARGGFTHVCSMPNLSPVPDTLEHVKSQLDIIQQDACIRVTPYASITMAQQGKALVDMRVLSPYVAGFSDDGRGVQQTEMMKSAMKMARSVGALIAAHCEVESLLKGGYIHDGEYAKVHHHKGIPSESEWEEIRRDIELARETGCKFHVCHISCKESVDLIRQAKKEGVDISCETAPHYLALDDSQLQEDGRFKMNPPIRSPRDREALIEGLLDGTIDMIATDHAPHSEEEKSRGLEKSLNGVVGLETSFAVMYTTLVKPGVLPLHRLVDLMSVAPNSRFGFPQDFLQETFTLFDTDSQFTVCPADFLSKGKSTPFAGMELNGRCLATVYQGKTVWMDHKAFTGKENP
jgi:dihydroorotase